MVENLDVLAVFVLARLDQVLLGFFVLLFLVEHPSHAVEVGGIVLIFLALEVLVLFALFAILVQRFLDHALGFVEVLIVVGPDVTQVVVVSWIVGILRQEGL